MDESYAVSFGLILNAGNSKSKSIMAIESAREFNFIEAKSLIEEASEDLRLAHQMQTDMIQKQAKGEEVNVDVILIHAQDHLTMATLMLDQAQEFINIYEMLNSFSKLKEEQ
ncbi:PTS lactose/cellobiose transporter subunit IIA [Enterococcus casseliflavus]|uniref:PTS lactose/cellobiose transporter subunit IIA n=1 Tax=Enterococcus TaxID=1350 RepID=UPI0022E15005|nr:PTS lactose/cellobiose transporter subunit IIA [Enterococcus casseliflavus]